MLRSNFYSALCGKPNFSIKKMKNNFPKGRNFRKVVEKKEKYFGSSIIFVECHRRWQITIENIYQYL